MLALEHSNSRTANGLSPKVRRPRCLLTRRHADRFLKGLDGSCPIGPVLVAPSAIDNPHNLRIRAIYNGEVVQDANTQ